MGSVSETLKYIWPQKSHPQMSPPNVGMLFIHHKLWLHSSIPWVQLALVAEEESVWEIELRYLRSVGIWSGIILISTNEPMAILLLFPLQSCAQLVPTSWAYGGQVEINPEWLFIGSLHGVYMTTWFYSNFFDSEILQCRIERDSAGREYFKG
jgi:hypothetical protein